MQARKKEDQDQDIELQNFQDEKQANMIASQKREIMAGAVESVSIIAVFGMFLKQAGRRLIDKEIGHLFGYPMKIGGFFIFPFIVAMSWWGTIESWRQKKLAEGKNGTRERFWINLLASSAFTVAVVGGFFWGALHVLLSPIIFTATLAVKTLFHLGAAIYYGVKACFTHDEEKKQRYNQSAKANAWNFFINATLTVAVGLAMVFGMPLWAMLGIGAAAVGTGLAIKKYRTLNAPEGAQAHEVANEEEQQRLLVDPAAVVKSEQQNTPYSSPNSSPRERSANALMQAALEQDNNFVTTSELNKQVNETVQRLKEIQGCQQSISPYSFTANIGSQTSTGASKSADGVVPPANMSKIEVGPSLPLLKKLASL